MASLLTDSEKSDIMDAFVSLHDTFSRDIKIFKRSSGQVEIVTNPNFNPLYGKIKDQKREDPSLQEFTKKARIKYAQNQSFINGSAADIQSNVSWPLGSVRLKVDHETFALIKDAQRIEIDGNLCEVVSDAAEIGPFSPQHKTIFLKRV